MTANPFADHPDRAALLGGVLILPALALVSQGLAFSLWGWTGGEAFLALPLAHPAVIVGGILVAIALNALVVLRLRVRLDVDAVAAELTVRRRGVNLAVLSLALALGAAILGYGFVENVLP